MSRVSLGVVFSALSLQAGIFPTVQIKPDAIQYFDQYVAKYENGTHRTFLKTGEMWIDQRGASQKNDFEEGRAHTLTLAGDNIPGAHIHHLFGTVRIKGAKLSDFVNTMQNYSRYTEYFKPDIAKSGATAQEDSTSQNKHFEVALEMVHSTAWIDLALDASYDTRYVYLDDKRVASSSRSKYIREYRDPHDRSQGTFPEGDDHGFLWRTYTSWHARERDGGLDLEFTSISLCRQIPIGVGWWANKTARATAEKMIQNSAAAIRKSGMAKQTSAVGQ